MCGEKLIRNTSTKSSSPKNQLWGNRICTSLKGWVGIRMRCRWEWGNLGNGEREKMGSGDWENW